MPAAQAGADQTAPLDGWRVVTAPTDRELVSWLIHLLGATNTIPVSVREAILAAQRENDASEWWLEQWLRKQPDG